jgi:hypothetical protein
LPKQVKMQKTLPLIGSLAGPFALGGCEEHVPSVNVLGAFFPAWMLCILAGITLALLARQLFNAIGLSPWIGPHAVIYPALAVGAMFATWIVFFQN